MDPILKNKLTQISENWEHVGFEGLNNIDAETYLDIESLLNIAINEAKDQEQDNLIRLRFFFRILSKYVVDIDRGMTLLLKYAL